MDLCVKTLNILAFLILLQILRNGVLITQWKAESILATKLIGLDLNGELRKDKK